MKEIKKKSHGVQLLIRAVVRDPDGKVISDTGRKSARSFLIQFLKYIYGLFWATGTITATATDGTEDGIYIIGRICRESFNVDAALNDGTHGVVVGTGDTAVTNTDYKLETKIAHGTGAGQLSHGSTTVGVPAVVGANVDFEVKRTFTNGSGDTITVTESGIYTKHTQIPYYHCIIRDVLPAGIDVPDKCSISIIYTLRTTV